MPGQRGRAFGEATALLSEHAGPACGFTRLERGPAAVCETFLAPTAQCRLPCLYYDAVRIAWACRWAQTALSQDPQQRSGWPLCRKFGGRSEQRVVDGET